MLGSWLDRVQGCIAHHDGWFEQVNGFGQVVNRLAASLDAPRLGLQSPR